MKVIFLATLLIGSIGFGQNEKAPHYEVVGDFSANSYTILYPLGWSKYGTFAYFIQDMNSSGEAWRYSFNLYIQQPGRSEMVYEKAYFYDLEEDTSYWHFEDEVNALNDSIGYITGWMQVVLWPEHGAEISKILNGYGIERTFEKELEPFEMLEKEDVEVVLHRESENVDSYGIDTLVQLYYKLSERDSVKFFEWENVLDEDGLVKDQFGNRQDLMRYYIDGIIKSPVKNQYFIYLVEQTFGFEEGAERVFMVGLKF